MMSHEATPLDAATSTYAGAFESLSPATLDRLAACLDEDVYFRDPFNEFSGRERLLTLFRTMFETLESPGFRVRDTAVSATAVPEVAYLRWTMTFSRKGRPYAIEGMSEVSFNEQHQVVSHIDHWDAASQVYAHVPVLGALIRIVRRRLA